MSYTIGIKRRFLPGYRKISVVRHSWENFRFILDLADGGQLVIPGFTAGGIKVYANFKNHIALLEESRRQAEARAREHHELQLAIERDYQRKAAAEERERVPAYQKASGQAMSQNPPAQPWLGDIREPQAHQPDPYIREPQAHQLDPLEVRARQNAQQRVQSILGSDGPAEGLADRSAIGRGLQ